MCLLIEKMQLKGLWLTYKRAEEFKPKTSQILKPVRG